MNISYRNKAPRDTAIVQEFVLLHLYSHKTLICACVTVVVVEMIDLIDSNV